MGGVQKSDPSQTNNLDTTVPLFNGMAASKHYFMVQNCPPWPLRFFLPLTPLPPSSLGQVKFVPPHGGPKTSSPSRANIYPTPLPTADPTPIYGNGCHQEAGKGFFFWPKKKEACYMR